MQYGDIVDLPDGGIGAYVESKPGVLHKVLIQNESQDGVKQCGFDLFTMDELHMSDKSLPDIIQIALDDLTKTMHYSWGPKIND